MRFKHRDQLQLALGETFVDRFTRFPGYIESIKLRPITGDETPSCCQVVLKLPWRYGLSDLEKHGIFIYLRVNAYTSSLCMGIPARVFRGGDIVAGFLEATRSNSEYESARLTEWGHSPLRSGKIPHHLPGALCAQHIHSVPVTTASSG